MLLIHKCHFTCGVMRTYTLFSCVFSFPFALSSVIVYFHPFGAIMIEWCSIIMLQPPERLDDVWETQWKTVWKGWTDGLNHWYLLVQIVGTTLASSGLHSFQEVTILQEATIFTSLDLCRTFAELGLFVSIPNIRCEYCHQNHQLLSLWLCGKCVGSNQAGKKWFYKKSNGLFKLLSKLLRWEEISGDTIWHL